MKIPIQLIQEDVNNLRDVDSLIFGSRCPLKDEIIKETKLNFNKVDGNSVLYSHQMEVLHADNYKWKDIVAVNYRSNWKMTESQFNRISDGISYLVKNGSSDLITILPFSHRNPEYVAIGTIYSIWLIAHGNTISFLKHEIGDISNTTFRIVSDDSVAVYEDVLKNDCDIMWKFIEKVFKRAKFQHLYPDYDTVRKKDIKFNVCK